ncbi:32204_t:CDS:2, partial [Gigaspora margarita]
PVLEENIELIQKEINIYEQKILDSAFIIEYKQQLTVQKQKVEKLKNQIETKIYLNDIDIEIPFEKLPEINNENNDDDKDNEIPNLRIPSQNWHLYIREPRTWKERLDQELAGVLSAQPTDKEVKSTIVSCPACGEWKGVSKFTSHLARCFPESQGESSQKPVSGVRPRRSSSRSKN